MATIAADPTERACLHCGAPVVSRYRRTSFCGKRCSAAAYEAFQRRRTTAKAQPETAPAPAPQPPARAQVAPLPSAEPAETEKRTSGQKIDSGVEIVRPAVPGRRRFAQVLEDLLRVERKIIQLATAPKSRMAGPDWLRSARSKAFLDEDGAEALDVLARTDSAVDAYIDRLATAFAAGRFNGPADFPLAAVVPGVGRFPATQDLRRLNLKRAGVIALASMRAIRAHPAAFTGTPAPFLDSRAEAELAALRIRLRRELQAAPDLHKHVVLEVGGVSIDERDRGLMRVRFRRPLPPLPLTQDWAAALASRLIEAETAQAEARVNAQATPSEALRSAAE